MPTLYFLATGYVFRGSLPERRRGPQKLAPPPMRAPTAAAAEPASDESDAEELGQLAATPRAPFTSTTIRHRETAEDSRRYLYHP